MRAESWDDDDIRDTVTTSDRWSVPASSHGECQVAGGGSLHPQEHKGHNNQHLDHFSGFVNVITFDAQILFYLMSSILQSHLSILHSTCSL